MRASFFITMGMKKKEKIFKLINIAIYYLLIFLFTYAGISKLMDHNTFKTTLMQSPVIANMSAILSWMIPLAVLFTVFLLIVNKYKYAGYLSSLILMSVFTAYIAYMILFIPYLPCSCGGIWSELTWGNHLVFNVILIILILTSMLAISKHKIFIAINRISRKPV